MHAGVQGGEGKARPQIEAEHEVLLEEAQRDNFLFQLDYIKARPRRPKSHERITRVSHQISDGQNTDQWPFGKASKAVGPKGRRNSDSGMEQMVGTSGQITNTRSGLREP